MYSVSGTWEAGTIQEQFNNEGGANTVALITCQAVGTSNLTLTT